MKMYLNYEGEMKGGQEVLKAAAETRKGLCYSLGHFCWLFSLFYYFSIKVSVPGTKTALSD